MATNTEESEFANAIAHYIGYDPRVVYSWAQLETGGHAIGHNWLNLRPYHANQGGPTDDVGVVGVTSGGFDIFDSVKSAAISSEHRLQQPFAAGIKQASGPGHSPAQEIAALAASDWDAGHYGGQGGPSIANVFAGLYGRDQLGAPASSHVVKGGGDQTQSSLTDKLTGVPGSGGPTSVLSGALSGAESFLEKWIIRGALIVLGTGLMLLGLYLIVRSLGAPSVGVMDKATTFATRGLVQPGQSRQASDAALGARVRREDARTARRQAREQAATERAREKRLAEYGDVPF